MHPSGGQGTTWSCTSFMAKGHRTTPISRGTGETHLVSKLVVKMQRGWLGMCWWFKIRIQSIFGGVFFCLVVGLWRMDWWILPKFNWCQSSWMMLTDARQFCVGWWLSHHPKKYESQIKSSSQLLGKNNIPNHQPVILHIWIQILHIWITTINVD